MKKVYGNLIDYAEQGYFDVIVHGCNCFHAMGAGIAKEIKKKYPAAYHTDIYRTRRGDIDKLGTYSSVLVKSKISNVHEFYILNGYTQYYYGQKHENSDIQIAYDSISSVFSKIKENFNEFKIGYPKIGSGLAGGDWNIISNIIETELDGCDHTLVIYE